jgi:hypothetical protein
VSLINIITEGINAENSFIADGMKLLNFKHGRIEVLMHALQGNWRMVAQLHGYAPLDRPKGCYRLPFLG